MPRATLLAVLCLVVAVAGCQSSTEPEAQRVGPVALEVPRSWERTDMDATDLVAQTRWASTGQRVTTLQVVVGCGDQDAESLALGAIRETRAGLAPTSADDPIDVEVTGLTDALRLKLTYGGDRPDDQETLRMAGLYGAGSGGMVLVEIAAPTTTWSDARATQVLDSVTVDDVALADSCAAMTDAGS